MNCEQIRHQLSTLLDGDLDEDIVADVEAHLAVCADCRTDREVLVSLDTTLAKMFLADRRRAESVAERVLLETSTRKQGPQPTTSTKWPLSGLLSYVIAAAAGFLLAVGLFRPWQNDEQRARLSPPAPTPGSAGVVLDLPVAHLVHATGPLSYRPPKQDVWVRVDGGELPVFTCPPASSVKTERGTLCELETTVGNRIRLNESSEIAIRSDEELELVKGQIWCRAAEDGIVRVVAQSHPQTANGPWTFHCPTSSECVMSFNDDGPLHVLNAGGKVDLIANGTVQELPLDKVCTFQGRDFSCGTSPDEILLAERWMQPLMILAGHSSTELTQRVDSLLAMVGRTKMSVACEQDLRSLGEYGTLPLTRFVQSNASSEDPSRRLAAMQIVADTAPIWMAPDLIALLEDDEPQVRGCAADALVRLTGESHGLTTNDWQGQRSLWVDGVARWKAWWQQHGDSCSPPPPGVSSSVRQAQ